MALLHVPGEKADSYQIRDESLGNLTKYFMQNEQYQDMFRERHTITKIKNKSSGT